MWTRRGGSVGRCGSAAAAISLAHVLRHCRRAHLGRRNSRTMGASTRVVRNGERVGRSSWSHLRNVHLERAVTAGQSVRS